jgi:hypothetical protein
MRRLVLASASVLLLVACGGPASPTGPSHSRGPAPIPPANIVMPSTAPLTFPSACEDAFAQVYGVRSYVWVGVCDTFSTTMENVGSGCGARRARSSPPRLPTQPSLRDFVRSRPSIG